MLRLQNENGCGYLIVIPILVLVLILKLIPGPLPVFLSGGFYTLLPIQSINLSVAPCLSLSLIFVPLPVLLKFQFQFLSLF